MADLIPINEEGDPWDQMIDEPTMWYERFQLYRLLGPGRNVSKAYRKHRSINTVYDPETSRKQGATSWYDYARQYNWEARANAWDETCREEVEDRAHEIYNDGLSFAHERVDKLKKIATRLEGFIMDDKTTRISPHVIEQYRGILDDIARERGERAKETHISGANGGNIVIETQWGRGGGASNAWDIKQIAPPTEAVDGVVKEITEETT
jgi:hypothetical protein